MHEKGKKGKGDSGDCVMKRRDKAIAIAINDCYLYLMNSRHRKTLATVFASPKQQSLAWADIETLLLAVGLKLYHET